MKYYKLIFEDGSSQVVSAKSDIDLIRTYDLATKKHINTKIIQYENDALAATVAALEANNGEA